MGDGEIEEAGEEGNSFGTQMLQMEHRNAVRTNGSRVFRSFYCRNRVFIAERGRRVIKAILMDLPVNSTGERVLFVRVNGAILSAKRLCDGRALSECFSLEVDWLVRRPIYSFPRKTTDQVCKFRWVSLGLTDFLLEGVSRCIVAGIPNPALKDRNLRIQRVRRPEPVALTDERSGLRREVRSEGSIAAGRDIAPRSL